MESTRIKHVYYQPGWRATHVSSIFACFLATALIYGCYGSYGRYWLNHDVNRSQRQYPVAKRGNGFGSFSKWFSQLQATNVHLVQRFSSHVWGHQVAGRFQYLPAGPTYLQAIHGYIIVIPFMWNHDQGRFAFNTRLLGAQNWRLHSKQDQYMN